MKRPAGVTSEKESRCSRLLPSETERSNEKKSFFIEKTNVSVARRFYLVVASQIDLREITFTDFQQRVLRPIGEQIDRRAVDQRRIHSNSVSKRKRRVESKDKI